MNNDGNHTVSVRDLAEEAKKRIVLLVVCVVGLSYLMSLTSSSVLVNLPAALFLILLIRYMSVDFDTRRKASAYKAKQRSDYCSSERSVFQGLKALKRPDWRFKVNSPVVEDAIEQFGRHIVSEWVTNLWYSRVTPDKQGPEELVLIMNGALGEICSRMRNINLIDLLTRDIINIISTRLELFRASIKKIENNRNHLTSEELDMKIKSILAAENKLHPILFSAEAEHMVLQCVVDGLILLILQPEDLQCSLFRYITRELLSCAVMRPVLNLANPRFVNQRIESAVIAARKAGKGNNKASTLSSPQLNESSTILPDQNSQFSDPSIKGVELVQLKKDQDNRTAKNFVLDDVSGTLLSKDPLLSMDTRTTRSWSSLPDDHGVVKGIQQQDTGGEWGNVLDEFSRRKTEALAPEHFDNVWAKGRNYKGKDDAIRLSNPILGDSLVGMSNSVNKPEVRSELMKEKLSTSTSIDKDVFLTRCNKENEEDSDALHGNFSSRMSKSNSLLKVEDVKSGSSAEAESWTSSNTEDDDTGTVMRLDSPGVKVWDSKNKRNFSHIHHPLETLERHKNRHKGQLHSKILHRRKSAKKRSKSVSHNGNSWQEVERTSFLLGDGQDSLNFCEVNGKLGESSEDSEEELLRRSYAGATTSSFMSLVSLPENQSLAANSAKNSTISESFFRLICEVLGANIVKSGSKTFAVYSISVTDVNGHSWSVKRRYQHFGELHRRLKKFSEYNLHLPPKHFLSTGLDVFVIQERCKLLDQYLKNLFQLPTVSSSIEVWDFLSVDSQMYMFSDSLYIIDTIPVDSGTTAYNNKEYQDITGPKDDPLSSRKENISNGSLISSSRIKRDQVSGGTGLKQKAQAFSLPKNPEGQFKVAFQNSNNPQKNTVDKSMQSSGNLERNMNKEKQESLSDVTDNASDPAIPSEWVPPNLSVPILDLVDVILQLKDGGWIRRQAFWAAKQVLQLGMGDAFDDWLIEKIQVLRRGSVIASGIKRLEQILWPDGIFITKHPSRQRPSSGNPSQNSPGGSSPTSYSSPKAEDALTLEEMQQRDAERRAKFVYELMIDNAPTAIVGLVGRREYEKCAKDLYYFIQSSVFLKQLAFDFLELLLSSAFPELRDVFKQFDLEKEKFGTPILSSQVQK